MSRGPTKSRKRHASARTLLQPKDLRNLAVTRLARVGAPAALRCFLGLARQAMPDDTRGSLALRPVGGLWSTRAALLDFEVVRGAGALIAVDLEDYPAAVLEIGAHGLRVARALTSLEG